MNNRAIVPILGILILVAGILSVGSILGILDLGSVVGYDSVYKQNYGSICCEEGALENPFVRYTDDYDTFTCDAYTDECRLKLTAPNGISVLADGFLYFKIDGRETKLSKNQIEGYTIVLPYQKTIQFIDKSGILAKDTRAYVKFSEQHRKFGIVGQENGQVFTTTDCILNSALRKRVGSDGLNELSRTGPNRCQSYLIDFVLTATKTYNYNGNEVVCQARNLYDVELETFKDGSTKKIQGSRIKSVDCCPSESGCTENFEFSQVNVRECTIDEECGNGGLPVVLTGDSYVTFGCNNGKCVQSSPVNVECTNNAICQNKYNDPSKVCKNFKCESDEQWLGHCGDGVCENVIGETPTSCPEDCGEWDKPFDWLFWITLGLIAVFILVFWKQIYMFLKSVLGRFGIRI